MGKYQRLTLAFIIAAVPPILFEKYTFFLYLSANPNFFTFSGYRLWFDLIWFGVAGALSAILLGRKTRLAVLPLLGAAFLLIIIVNAKPFCDPRECYVSSTDGLASLRDFLLLGSLGVTTAAASLKSWFNSTERHGIADPLFQLGVVTLLGYALSFFQLMHIFAGVTAPYPENYLQWFLAGAPSSLTGSMLILDRGNLNGIAAKLLAGSAGVILGLTLAFELPCADCGGNFLPIVSILALAAGFALPACLLEVKWKRSRKKGWIPKGLRKAPTITASAVIILTIVLMWGFFFATNYQASVVNGFVGVKDSSFSPLEVGRAFVYAGGYLAIPRVVSQSVGVNVSFGHTTINQTGYPNDFLSAGVGDQSPNCCKDGLDLAYRADVVMFSNGTEAAVARAWWACDVNIACGGYSWQQLLHLGLVRLPVGALSNWVELEMNWSSPTSVEWFYKMTSANGTSTSWTLFSSFTPPKIQKDYWDAGLFLVGTANLPEEYAYFYQFGVSSAYPINQASWQVFEKCPEIVLNGSWSCIPKAGYTNGDHSFWKVLYTWGRDYPGVVSGLVEPPMALLGAWAVSIS
ncbi:MAG: hypothetical protein M1587_05605, partial [Thaumarchaeota archaeon]|nr:hypothetical protein [Nitrososphaerota archaeon]